MNKLNLVTDILKKKALEASFKDIKIVEKKMNKKTAKEIAKTITNEQLFEMFVNAKDNIFDWTQTSSVNKGMSKGTSWNILARNFDKEFKYSNIAITNMIHEFGDYLPEHLKQTKEKQATKSEVIVHQDPIFENYKQLLND